MINLPPPTAGIISTTWLFLLLMSSLRGANGCPVTCTCRWKGGKETVECVGAKLMTIPAGIAEGTQVLDLSINNFPHLPKEMLLTAGLLNVQRLYLANCSVSNIEDTTFQRLTNLVELDLSGNKLTSVPSNTFKAISALRRLMLNNNPISRIENNAFAELAGLTSLELSRCKIESVSTKAFHGFTNLLQLKLDNNKLKILNGPSLATLTNLHGVELAGNNWICNCKLREMRQWLVTYNIPYTLPPLCDAPVRLKTAVINDLPVEEFACDPRITHQPPNKNLNLYVGDNASLPCHVRADPEVDITWFWQGLDISNSSLFPDTFDTRRFVIQENGSLDKVSILFIHQITQEFSGDYMCIGENRAGYVNINYLLNVTEKRIVVASTMNRDKSEKNMPAQNGALKPDSLHTQIVGLSIGLICAFAVASVITCLLLMKCLCCVIRSGSKAKKNKKRTNTNSVEMNNKNCKVIRSDGDMCGSIPVIRLDGSPPPKTHHNHIGVGTNDDPIHIISNSNMQYDVPNTRWHACSNGPTSLHQDGLHMKPDLTVTSNNIKCNSVDKSKTNKRSNSNGGWFSKFSKRTSDSSPDSPRRMIPHSTPVTPPNNPERLLTNRRSVPSVEHSSNQSSPASTIVPNKFLPSYNAQHKCPEPYLYSMPTGGQQTTDEDCDDSTTISSCRSHQAYVEPPRQWRRDMMNQHGCDWPPPPPEADANYDVYELSACAPQQLEGYDYPLPPPPSHMYEVYDKPRSSHLHPKMSPSHSDDERLGSSSRSDSSDNVPAQRPVRHHTLPHPQRYKPMGVAVMPAFPAHILPRVRESPDEGYEDEGEDGTEV